MVNMRIVNGGLFIDAPPGTDVNVPALQAVITLGAAIEAWEVASGAEMSDQLMEFARQFFYSGYKVGREAGRAELL